MELDINSLTNVQIKNELSKYGFTPGPITASTKPIYISKLIKFINGNTSHANSNYGKSPIKTKSTPKKTKAQVNKSMNTSAWMDESVYDEYDEDDDQYEEYKQGAGDSFSNNSLRSRGKHVDTSFNTSDLTNAQIKQQLCKFGYTPGPITDTTRPIYLAKLLKFTTSGNVSQVDTNKAKYNDSPAKTPKKNRREVSPPDIYVSSPSVNPTPTKRTRVTRTTLRTPKRASMGPLHSTVIGDISMPITTPGNTLYELSDEELISAEIQSPILSSTRSNKEKPATITWMDSILSERTSDVSNKNQENVSSYLPQENSLYRPTSSYNYNSTAAATAFVDSNTTYRSSTSSKLVPSVKVPSGTFQKKKKPKVQKSYSIHVFLFFASLILALYLYQCFMKSSFSTENEFGIDFKCSEEDKMRGFCPRGKDKSLLMNILSIAELLADHSGRFDCGNPMTTQRHVSLIAIEDHLRNNNRPAVGSMSSVKTMEYWQDKLNQILSQIKEHPEWQLRLLDSSGHDTHDHDVVAMESVVAHKTFFCKVKQSVNTIAYFGGVVLIAAVFVTIVYYTMRLRKLHKEEHENEVHDLVEKVVDMLEDKDSVSEEYSISTGIPVSHIRDILIPSNQRVKKQALWKEVEEFIYNNESRVTSSGKVINGETYKMWNWIQNPLPKSPSNENTYSASKNYQSSDITSNLSKTNSNETWRGKAVEETQNYTARAPSYATECIKIRKMFSPEEHLKEYQINTLKNILLEKCGNDVITYHISVACDTGCIYMKFADRISGGRAFENIHTWWYKHDMVTVKYIRLSKYYERFPESEHMSHALQPSVNRELPPRVFIESYR